MLAGRAAVLAALACILSAAFLSPRSACGQVVSLNPVRRVFRAGLGLCNTTETLPENQTLPSGSCVSVAGGASLRATCTSRDAASTWTYVEYTDSLCQVAGSASDCSIVITKPVSGCVHVVLYNCNGPKTSFNTTLELDCDPTEEASTTGYVSPGTTLSPSGSSSSSGVSSSSSGVSASSSAGGSSSSGGVSGSTSGGASTIGSSTAAANAEASGTSRHGPSIVALFFAAGFALVATIGRQQSTRASLVFFAFLMFSQVHGSEATQKVGDMVSHNWLDCAGCKLLEPVVGGPACRSKCVNDLGLDHFWCGYFCKVLRQHVGHQDLCWAAGFCDFTWAIGNNDKTPA